MEMLGRMVDVFNLRRNHQFFLKLAVLFSISISNMILNVLFKIAMLIGILCYFMLLLGCICFMNNHIKFMRFLHISLSFVVLGLNLGP